MVKKVSVERCYQVLEGMLSRVCFEIMEDGIFHKRFRGITCFCRGKERWGLDRFNIYCMKGMSFEGMCKLS